MSGLRLSWVGTDLLPLGVGKSHSMAWQSSMRRYSFSKRSHSHKCYAAGSVPTAKVGAGLSHESGGRWLIAGGS